MEINKENVTRALYLMARTLEEIYVGPEEDIKAIEAKLRNFETLKTPEGVMIFRINIPMTKYFRRFFEIGDEGLSDTDFRQLWEKIVLTKLGCTTYKNDRGNYVTQTPPMFLMDEHYTTVDKLRIIESEKEARGRMLKACIEKWSFCLRVKKGRSWTDVSHCMMNERVAITIRKRVIPEMRHIYGRRLVTDETLRLLKEMGHDARLRREREEEGEKEGGDISD